MFRIILQVGTNGYFTFEMYTGYIPFLFNENSSISLVAPFFTDIDIEYNMDGQINYEIHTIDTSESIISQINSIVNTYANTEFYGEWLLVATWEDVPPYFGVSNEVSK